MGTHTHDSFWHYYLKWQKTKTLETTGIFIIGEYINKIWCMQTVDIMDKTS